MAAEENGFDYDRLARTFYDGNEVTFSVVGSHDPSTHLTSGGSIEDIKIRWGDEFVPVEELFGDEMGPDFDGGKLAAAMMGLVRFRHNVRVS